MKETDIFPIEVDLDLPTFHQKQYNYHDDDDEIDDDDENDQVNNIDNHQQKSEDIDLLNIGD
jgi:hypothetical protein